MYGCVHACMFVRMRARVVCACICARACVCLRVCVLWDLLVYGDFPVIIDLL